MNLTHINKQGRDHLGPLNTNITYINERSSSSKDKERLGINRNRS